MASIIGVETLQHTNGTTAATIDSSGKVSLPNSVWLDQWRLTTNFSTNSAVITGWERVDDASFSKVGSGMTQSSGVWSFPVTGLWSVRFYVALSIGAADTSCNIDGYTRASSSDTYDQILRIAEGSSAAENPSTGGEAIINVTSTDYQLKFETQSLGGSSALVGDTNFNRSYITFQRITDSQ